MYCGITYKDDIETIKGKIRDNYMSAAYNFVNSGEYSSRRKTRLAKLFLYNFIYIALCGVLGYFACTGGDDTSFFALSFPAVYFILFLLTFLIGFICYFQNKFFGRDIKNIFAKYIMKDISEFEYINDGDGELSNTGLITEDDIKEIEVTDYYSSVYVDDTFSCKHNETDFSFKEINLIKGSGKSSRSVFSGMFLKASPINDIKGYIDIKTVETFKKTEKIRDLVVTSILFSFIFFNIFFMIIAERLFESGDFFLAAIAGLAVISLVVAFVISKLIYDHQNKKSKLLLNKLRRDDDFVNINEKLIVKASPSAVADSAVLYELSDIIGKLSILFNTDKIYCKIKDNKALLAVKSKENLFEQGGLLKSPADIKVADRLVSQLTGIFIFTDFIDKVFNGNLE